MNLNDFQETREMIIVVAGEPVKVLANQNVKETLKNILASKGIDSFTILVDGDEITDTNDLPETFAQADNIEIQRYVKPGC